ncbi:23S rRNA (adenine1618-N6)-methyltransferase [Sporothrix brasiliensis 5110]|uniref:23S rRNA (Adenine1618-N6)-methyltransferase n=1 Tax=Sporothrix brasiliensis 5110 TaxID=1398154 RepID=A0A0C2FNS8_9PEZI|nr:23S rRNA (adenine1618-N6)-methyltransferase [Sporothrix brasiliensis 5110]KIH92663.1 23S rRNA (adenine1618-N6)-methyltransferase [Sporothrix brasiliensis 5110]
MADVANNSGRDPSTDTLATPASTTSLYVVDDQMNDGAEGAHPEPAVPRRPDAYYRDLYKDRLDFRALARDDPDLQAVLHNGQLDFRDPAAVRQLTITLLWRDFGLKLELPENRLCPPIPNRHNYVVWIKALMEDDGPAVGLDIGTGASCIYPLLACAQRPKWQFLATDIDAESLTFARGNVARNGLEDRIQVVARSPDERLICTGADPSATSPSSPSYPSLDFTMCNPPFYASADEMTASVAAKKQPPHSACTGAPVEMVYAARDGHAGGEIAFVGRILDESAKLRSRVRWYTAMLGKLASLNVLVGQLRARGIDNYAVAAFVQGTKTRRWALGWSYGARRPTMAAARGGSDASGLESYRHLLPPISEVDVLSVPRGNQATSATNTVSLSTAIDALMQSLALAAWDWDKEALLGVGRARENVWGRAWRRKKQREERAAAEGGPPQPTEDPATLPLGRDEDPAFGFVVTVRVGVTETIVHCRWLEGHNEAMYQSFCGFLKDKLKISRPEGE